MTFTPPDTESYGPVSLDPVREGVDPLAQRLFRFYPPENRAGNVYITTDGEVLTETPTTTYHEDGSIDQTGQERTARVFRGGHEPETVTEAERALLEAAGYEVED